MEEHITPEAMYANQTEHMLRPCDIQPLLEHYKAPTAKSGMLVAWYPRKQSVNKPHIGIVHRVHNPFLDILVLTEAAPFKESVLHVTDPRLRLPHRDETSGCWDYTDEYREHRKWLRWVEKRITDLERSLKKD